ncbi:MAG: hypothetical protein PHI97_28425 [Desulfobulbus sp.]|nr:hypothetical protein [Desulfobulbus sp.]
MDDRYYGKIVSILNDYEVVINRGNIDGVKKGNKFIIVGLGDVIVDPDTMEELERLEIVRGNVEVTHVQEKISTAKSCDFEKDNDKKQIKRVSSKGGIAQLTFMGNQDTVTETIEPGESRLKELSGPEIGDSLIKL